MPSDGVVNHYIDRLGGSGPEFLLTIGVILILAYVAVKAIPMIKDLRLRKIDHDAEFEMKRLEIEEMREKRKAEEAMREDERDRARTEVIGKQNEIQANLVRSNDGMAIQFAALQAALEESKSRSRLVGDQINSIDTKINEIHTVVVKAK